MVKAKLRRSNGCENRLPSDSVTVVAEHDMHLNNLTNVSTRLNDDNPSGIVQGPMNKRRNHLNNIRDRPRKVRVLSDDEDDMLDNHDAVFDNLTQIVTCTNTNPSQIEHSSLFAVRGFSPEIPTPPTIARNNGSVSSFSNSLKLNRGTIKSSSKRENNELTQYSRIEKCISTVSGSQSDALTNNNEHGSTNVDLVISEDTLDCHETLTLTTPKHATNNFMNFTGNNEYLKSSDLPSESNISKIKTPYVSNSVITFDTPIVNKNKGHGSSIQIINRSDIDRSIIRIPDYTARTHNNVSSTDKLVQLCKEDILCSIEYRELEKNFKNQKAEIAKLRSAVKILCKERKRFKQTHMLKPRPSFWSEFALFMDSHNELFTGDGRTIQEIGAALNLTDAEITRVRQDADKPDKIAMNIWRVLCPTHVDRLFVGSIKHVPATTLRNIHMLARLCFPKMNLNFKKMKNDIATSIRQSSFHARQDSTASTTLNEQSRNRKINDDNGHDNNDQYDDYDQEDNDDNAIDESQDMSIDVTSFLRKENLIDADTDEDE